MTPELIHAHFKAKPGSEQIASLFAIRQVMQTVKRKRPARILEIGAGIGTLTTAIIAATTECTPDIYYTEDDPGCLAALEENLGVAMAYVRHINPEDWTHAVTMGPFDLVIVDGDADPVGVALALHDRALVIVEGNRRSWRGQFERRLRFRVWARLHLKPWDRSKGVWLYHLNATQWERLTFAVRQRWQDLLDLVHAIACRVTGREPALGKKRRIQ